MRRLQSVHNAAASLILGYAALSTSLTRSSALHPGTHPVHQAVMTYQDLNGSAPA